MLLVLLQKDFLRMARNPWPLLLNLGLPLAITALIGLAFGGGDAGPSVARIKVAIVDQDESLLGSLCKSALTQGDAAKHFEIITPGREEAVRLLRENKISAALVVPPDFTKSYFNGQSGLSIEVIKNPAQSFYPAIVEELSAVAVTGLNAISRNLQGEFPQFQAALTNKFDFLELAGLFTRLGERVKHARDYLTPPLVMYKRETIASEKKAGPGSGFSIFGFVLPGMASAFLLFLADHSMRDLHKEKRAKTLDRIRSATTGTGAFVTSKVLLAALTVMAGSAILFSTGAFVFGIDWGRPGLMALVCIGYAVFAAGFVAMLVAIAPLGGCWWPLEIVPEKVRLLGHLFPSAWAMDALHQLISFGGGIREIAASLLILLGFAAAASLGAVRFFRA